MESDGLGASRVRVTFVKGNGPARNFTDNAVGMVADEAIEYNPFHKR